MLAPCPVFIVRASPKEGIAVERRTIPAGAMEVLSRSPEASLLDVVLPVGPGGSGSVATRGDGSFLILRCDSDSLHLKIRDASGSSRDRPVRPLEELRQHDVRVSVRGDGDTSGTFVIQEWSRVERDTVGPVKDPFGDQVPLGPDDFVIFTETYLHSSGPPATGQAPLTYDGHLRVPVEMVGVSNEMFLDLGGAGTLVGRSFLPDSVEVREANMVEYSGAGRRLLDYAPGGATGKVTGIEGLAHLPVLRVGSIEFRDVDVVVMTRLPDWFPEGVAGIVGLDLLRRARFVTLEIPPTRDERGRLVLSSGPGDAAVDPPGTIRVPFAFATHLFVRGRIGDREIHLILDTGAPRSMLDEPALEELALPAEGSRKIQGLDEEGARVVRSSATLELGGRAFEVPFEVGPLAPFAPIRNADQLGGLLGNAFLARFRRLNLDFERGEMTLWADHAQNGM